MRKEWLRGLKEKLLLGALTLALVSVCGMWGGFVCHAESQAKVTARSANIRKEASTSSAVVGSTKKDSVLTVVSQVQGADGKTWYEVYVDANMKGYIRSDLVTITEGGTPPETGAEEPPADVTAVNPVSGTVSNDSGRGRVRSNASTTSQILAEVPNGAEMTVTGQAQDGEGKIWYQVSYASENGQVDGFIRSDYLQLSGDLTPAGSDAPDDGGDNPPAPSAPDKAYDTIFQDGEWFLYDTATNDGYSVKSLFGAVDKANENAKLYEELEKSATNQKIIIIVLIFLVVAAVAVIAFLVFKIRDMMDAAYFSEVENDTLRKKKAAGQGGGQRVMHTVGTDQQPGRSGAQGGAPRPQRPQGSGQGGPQSQRPQGGPQAGSQRSGQGSPQRPQGSGPAAGPQGQRPQGVGPAGGPQRPQGGGQGGPQRPQGGGQAGPQGSGQGGPQGQRQQGAPQRMPEGGQAAAPQGQRPQGAPQGSPQRPQGARPGGAPVDSQQRQPGGAQRQAKNFMAEEEDEFDFDFLNYDEDGEQQ